MAHDLIPTRGIEEDDATDARALEESKPRTARDANRPGGSKMEREFEGFAVFGRTYRSERAAIVSFLDKVRVGERNAAEAFAAWADVCQTERLRTALRIIAEREAYHARVFEKRLEELGGEQRATVSDGGREFRARLADPSISDLEKLRCFTAEVGAPEDAVKSIQDLAELLREDLETKEALRLFAEDELSTTRWIWDTCRALVEPVAPGRRGHRKTVAG